MSHGKEKIKIPIRFYLYLREEKEREFLKK